VRGRLSRVEQRITGPYVIDVVDPQVRMLEQVRGLGIDLERSSSSSKPGSNRSPSTQLLYYKRLHEAVTANDRDSFPAGYIGMAHARIRSRHLATGLTTKATAAAASSGLP
jgi:hypothetical protein